MIVSQQLSVKAADTIFLRLHNLILGNRLTPENILCLNDLELKDVGLSRAKIGYLKDLANKVKNKEIILKDLDRLSDQNVIVELTKIKGIGKWTAEMFLMFALGRDDIFSMYDLGLQNAVKKIYKNRLPLDKTGNLKYDLNIIEDITLQWSPYRTIASIILWYSLKL